jgi:putative ABC transport system permease protein
MARFDRLLHQIFRSLYPRDFRARHDRELDEIYTWCLQVERGRRGSVSARLKGFVDAVRGAIALRRRVEPIRRSPMGTVGQDLLFAMRTWRRAPWFAAGAVLVLALGIGANGAIFSLVRAVLLEPLPYDRPDEVVMVWHSRPDRPQPRVAISTPIKRWRDANNGALQDLAALMLWQGNLEARFDLIGSDGAMRLRAGLVTPNFFSVLGTRPLHGRLFVPADEDPAHANLVVLSHALWQRAFGADPAVIGRTVTLVTGRRDRAPRPHVVIGVLPPGFRFTYPVDTEIWSIYPWARLNADPGDAIRYNAAVARLAPGLTFEAANRMMGRVDPGYDAEGTPADRRSTTHLQRISDWVAGETRPTLALLSGVALMLLVIASATIANGLLVRLAERERELALRAALGAGRLRLLRQLLTEGLALAVVGTAVGCALAVWLLPIFRSLVPPVVPRADEMAVNVWMITFAAAAATLVTVLAALVPALQGSRQDLVTSLKQASGTASASRGALRWRLSLVGLQAAVATALLVGAALLLLSFWRLGRVDLGFEADGVWTVEMRMLDPRFFGPGGMAPFQNALVDRVRAIPGVVEVGLTTAVPFRGVDFLRTYDAPGCEHGPGDPAPPGCQARSIGAQTRTVDPAFFSIMRMTLLRGRLLQPTDGAGSPNVMVVSDSFAREMFGDRDPIGQRLDRGQVEIVGVVADVRYERFDREARAAVYYPRAQRNDSLVCLIVRAAPGAGAIEPALRAAVRDVDPTVPAMDITTIDRILSASVSDRRFYTTTTGAFAGLALVLTGVGLVVIVARSVVERRRETAIRAALGARAGQLVGLIARQGLAPVLAGVAVGLTGAWFGAAILEPFLFQITIHEPAVYAAAGALVAGIGAAACLLPAWRLIGYAPALVLKD